MKKLVASLTFILACSVQAQTNVVATTNAPAGWVAPITVTAVASGIRICNFGATIEKKTGAVTAMISWEWVDAQGVVVRNGITRYDGKKLDELLQTQGLSLAMMKQVFTTIAAAEAVSPSS